MNLKNKIFNNYHSIHGNYIDSKDTDNFQVIINHFCNRNYSQYLPKKNSNILEIGCGKGYTLKWLDNKGYYNITGVDLSPDDVEFANNHIEKKVVIKDDIKNFLKDKNNYYDCIIAKAILEHIKKEQIDDLLKLVLNSLKINGRIIIVVPNMDWIMSGHERYMDLTHEVGFTKESLGQLLRLYFCDVTISPAKTVNSKSFFSNIRNFIIKPFVTKIFRIFLSFLGEGANNCWFEYGAILGTGTKKE